VKFCCVPSSRAPPLLTNCSLGGMQSQQCIASSPPLKRAHQVRKSPAAGGPPRGRVASKKAQGLVTESMHGRSTSSRRRVAQHACAKLQHRTLKHAALSHSQRSAHTQHLSLYLHAHSSHMLRGSMHVAGGGVRRWGAASMRRASMSPQSVERVSGVDSRRVQSVSDLSDGRTGGRVAL
jgi:hypothetical protein